jgi:hypothetical protein
MNRTDLQEAYIHQLIDGMDHKTMYQFVFDTLDIHKTMYQFVYDTLDESLSKYSEEDLLTEVEAYYPELLEGN